MINRPARTLWFRLVAVAMSAIMSLLPMQGASAQGRVRLIRDAEIESTIRAYADPLFRAAGLDPTVVQVHIIDDKRINAFVAGGMQLFLNTGLLMQAEKPNDVIGVIAHETGHIQGGHLARINEELRYRTIEAIIGLVAGIGIGLATGSGDAGVATSALGQQVAQRNLLKYSRGQEAAADQSGMKLLDATGQSAEGMQHFFEILSHQEALLESSQDPYLRTHPLTRDRIDAISSHVANSPYKGKKDPPELIIRHQRMLAKLNGFLLPISQVDRLYPEKDQSVPARYARAIALFRSSRMADALAEMDNLLSEAPDDPFFLEQKAQILYENGRIREALPLYQKALDIAPTEPLLRFELGQAMVETEDPSQLPSAIAHLNEVTRLEPKNGRAWELLAIANGRNGDLATAALCQAEEALARGRVRDAKEFARRAMDKLPEGSPSWLRAQDILFAVQPDDDEE